jgi:hypothetical protein
MLLPDFPSADELGLSNLSDSGVVEASLSLSCDSLLPYSSKALRMGWKYPTIWLPLNLICHDKPSAQTGGRYALRLPPEPRSLFPRPALTARGIQIMRVWRLF